MKNLVLSQFYTLRTEMKILAAVFAVLVFTGTASMLFDSGYFFFLDSDFYGYGERMTASTVFGNGAGFAGVLSAIYVLFSVTLIAGGDMNDKTVNYEIMYGHSRRSVYWSRVTVSLAAGTFGGVLIFAAVPLIVTLMLGWGTSISVSVLLIRVFMLTMLFLRISSELMFLTAVIRKAQFVYITEAVVLITEIALSLSFQERNRYLFPFDAVSSILHFNSFRLEHLDSTASVVFDAAMPGTVVVSVSAAYILVSAVCLYLGASAFERSDFD